MQHLHAQSGAGYFRATKGGRAVKIDIKYSTGKTLKGWGGWGVCVCVCKGMPQNPRRALRFHSDCKIWLQESRFVKVSP